MKTSDDAFDADIDLDEEETLEEEGLEGEELTQSDWEDDEADGEARADASEEDLGEARNPAPPWCTAPARRTPATATARSFVSAAAAAG